MMRPHRKVPRGHLAILSALHIALLFNPLYLQAATLYDDLIGATAHRYRVEPALVKAVIRCESNFDALAVSPKGAEGLMQLMLATQATLGVTDAFDPAAKYRCRGALLGHPTPDVRHGSHAMACRL